MRFPGLDVALLLLAPSRARRRPLQRTGANLRRADRRNVCLVAACLERKRRPRAALRRPRRGLLISQGDTQTGSSSIPRPGCGHAVLHDRRAAGADREPDLVGASRSGSSTCRIQVIDIGIAPVGKTLTVYSFSRNVDGRRRSAHLLGKVIEETVHCRRENRTVSVRHLRSNCTPSYARAQRQTRSVVRCRSAVAVAGYDRPSGIASCGETHVKP